MRNVFKGLILAGIGFLMGILAMSPDYKPGIQVLEGLPKIRTVPQKPDASIPPVIQLLDKKGNFHCTAVVFDPQYAVTAAHCLADSDNDLLKEPFEVRDGLGKKTGVKALPVGLNRRIDFGILKGDFTRFKMAQINTEQNGFFLGRMFMACGFAYGQNTLTCTPFFPKNNAAFHTKGVGALVPGMSGGPVVDIESNTVIAVNSAVGDNEVYVVPLTGLLGAFGIQPRAE